MNEYHSNKIDYRVQLDEKYSERVQLPAKPIADCHHNGVRG